MLAYKRGALYNYLRLSMEKYGVDATTPSVQSYKVLKEFNDNAVSGIRVKYTELEPMPPYCDTMWKIVVDECFKEDITKDFSEDRSILLGNLLRENNYLKQVVIKFPDYLDMYDARKLYICGFKCQKSLMSPLMLASGLDRDVDISKLLMSEVVIMGYYDLEKALDEMLAKANEFVEVTRKVGV